METPTQGDAAEACAMPPPQRPVEPPLSYGTLGDLCQLTLSTTPRLYTPSVHEGEWSQETSNKRERIRRLLATRSYTAAAHARICAATGQVYSDAEPRRLMRLGKYVRRNLQALFPGATEAEGAELASWMGARLSAFTDTAAPEGWSVAILRGEEAAEAINSIPWYQGSGSISGLSSCMSGEKSCYWDAGDGGSPLARWLAANPGNMGLAVIRDEAGRIISRRIAWTLDADTGTAGAGKVYLDRAYTRTYLDERGYCTASSLAERIWASFARAGGHLNQRGSSYEDRITLRSHDDCAPYMDTWVRGTMNGSGGIVISMERGSVLLQETDGSLEYDKDTSYCSCCEEYRHEFVSVYRSGEVCTDCAGGDDYVFVSRGYANGYYVHVDDAVYCEDIGEYVLERDAEEATIGQYKGTYIYRPRRAFGHVFHEDDDFRTITVVSRIDPDNGYVTGDVLVDFEQYGDQYDGGKPFCDMEGRTYVMLHEGEHEGMFALEDLCITYEDVGGEYRHRLIVRDPAQLPLPLYASGDGASASVEVAHV